MKILGIVLVLFPYVVQLNYGITSASAVPRGDYADLRLFETPAAFSVESAVLLNDAAARDKEVGYKIKARLHVAPLWAHEHKQYLLKFDLHSPKLHLRGKHFSAEFLPHGSIWDSHSESTFYVHWKWGAIEAVYLDPEEPLDILNYKKSLASLFQFQTMDGEYNETDISGTCKILYETISINVFRKIKRSCSTDAAVSSARRATRYTLEPEGGGGGLAALHADELLTLGAAGGEGEGLGLKVRSWVAMQRLEPAPPAAAGAGAASLSAALAALPPALRPLPLELSPADRDHALDDTTIDVAIVEGEAALAGEEPGEGGDAAAAVALLRLLPALRAASRDRLARLLQQHAHHRLLPGLCRALGLLATPQAHRAAAHFLQLDATEPHESLALTYLAAVALATSPHETTVREVLRLGEEAPAPAVARAALLAGAAAASRLPDEAAQRDARDSLTRSLARCEDEPCRATRLHALANLRCANTADLLLEHAERGAAAALDALDALPPTALPGPRLRRLVTLALGGRAPLDVRAAALDLAVRRSEAHVGSLAWAARALAERAPRDAELRRLLWQRLEGLGAARRLAGMMESSAGGWAARAAGGTSSVVGREAWAGGGWRARLDSLQVAERAVLRRGRVRLTASSPAQGSGPHDDLVHLMEVEVWTRGLDALAGGDGATEGPGEGEEEGAAGGLSVAVAGVRMSPVTLFTGQAELLGHVWAGRGSSATRVTRALVPLVDRAAPVSVAGGAAVAVERRAALALALDAAAQVSLWWKSAHTSLQLRAAAALETRAALRTAWGDVRARSLALAAPRLRISADLDFYDEVALCARVVFDPYSSQRNVTLESVQGARRLRVVRERRAALAAPGRTLALGRPNDAVCRTLRAADADADAEADADADADAA